MTTAVPAAVGEEEDLAGLAASWEITLRAERKAPGTIRAYVRLGAGQARYHVPTAYYCSCSGLTHGGGAMVIPYRDAVA
jgi:hypothetical protein